jgi:hypothetical protein
VIGSRPVEVCCGGHIGEVSTSQEFKRHGVFLWVSEYLDDPDEAIEAWEDEDSDKIEAAS